jgi:oligogalacturonide lyase
MRPLPFLPHLLLVSAFTLTRTWAADAPAAPGTPEYDNSSRAAAPTTTPDLGPREWIDPDTGHRVIRISNEPDSESLYFHYNAYTPEGDKMVFSSPRGIFTLDLKTLGQGVPKVDWIVDGRRDPNAAAGGGGRGGRGGGGGGGTSVLLMAAFGSRDAYYTSNGALYAVNVDTKVSRLVITGRPFGVNSDETYVGSMVNQEDPTGKVQPPTPPTLIPQRERMFGDKIKAGIPLTPDEEYAANKEDGLARRLLNPSSLAFVFTNLKTKTSVTVGYQYASIDHQQFNPVDPNLVLYAHEGTWHEVDRIWTIRTDGSAQRLMFKRTMDMEIVGHEWWGHDGKMIWFDMQTPRSKDFWIGGVNVDTGQLTQYHIQRNWWGVHFNSSRDNTLFASDGGDPTQVAFCQDGEWINLFRVQPDGSVTREKLVNMSQNNYVTGQGGIEPNVSITPDNKWVVFRANMHGGTVQVYAVEIGGDPAKISKPEKFVATN